MRSLHKFGWLALLTIAAACSQSQVVRAQDSTQAQGDTSSKPAPDAAEKPAAAPAAPLPDSTGVEVLVSKKADYPMEAREKQIQGEVIVKVTISETGTVEKAEVISGNPILAQAALEAAKKWTFKPYIKNGKPTNVATRIPFDFAFKGKVMENGISEDRTTTAGSATPGVVRPAQPVTAASALFPPPARAEYKLGPVATPNAEYPDKARKKKIEGQMIATFVVSESGDVISVHASGFNVEAVQALQGAVRDAVSKWKFKPVIKDGNPIQVFVTAKFMFALKDESERTNGVPGEIAVATDVPKLERVRVSSGVIRTLLIRQVAPVYPDEARRKRIEGTVLLQAVIDKEGRVADLRLISGPPELVQAAIGAVQQWRYRPYLLDGQPVEVDTQLQVNFKLR